MRNMTRRRMMLISSSQGKSRLPEEYQEVAWLRGTGTQYSTLPYSPVNTSEHFYGMKGDFTLIDTGRYTLLDISAQNANQSSIYWRIWGVSTAYGSVDAGVYRSNNLSNGYLHYPNDNDVLDIHFEINKTNIVINDSIMNNPNYDYHISDRICIGRRDTTVYNQNVNIKPLALYDNDTKLCDIIPCYRKSDNKAGFYVTVVPEGYSNFIVNQATGSDWLVGPNV